MITGDRQYLTIIAFGIIPAVILVGYMGIHDVFNFFLFERYKSIHVNFPYTVEILFDYTFMTGVIVVRLPLIPLFGALKSNRSKIALAISIFLESSYLFT